jgi:predicted DNA-binding protein with PD1-like motif
LSWAQEKLPHLVAITLQDQSGAVLPNGRVRVLPLDGTGATDLLTNGRGIAYFNGAPERYGSTASAPEFASQSRIVDVTGAGQAVTCALPLDGAHSGSSGPVVTFPDVEPVTEQSKQLVEEPLISPARPIPTGQAPGMKVKLVSQKGGEKVYAVIFSKGDEVLSGLTDFAIQYKVGAAHFTGIGALSGATLGWLDLAAKAYHPLHVDEQVEVLSIIGDVATFNGKPVVHAHMVMGKRDGTTVGGHLWEAHVNPTLEVFVSVDPVPLKKKADDASGMKLIDPAE